MLAHEVKDRYRKSTEIKTNQNLWTTGSPNSTLHCIACINSLVKERVLSLFTYFYTFYVCGYQYHNPSKKEIEQRPKGGQTNIKMLLCFAPFLKESHAISE